MILCQRLDELPALGKPLHLALGVFDGVHLGHQAVIERAVIAAKREGGLAGLVTFDPHPIRVIAPAKAPSALLETLAHKACIVAGLGMELIVPLKFDKEMAALAASEFLTQLTAAPIRTIAVGEDWHFGHNRSGDVVFLREHAAKLGFDLQAVPPVMFEGDRISSTRIRQAIHDGNLYEAARMLGRPYIVGGKVVKGDQLGRTLGFPTANIPTGEVQLPPDGVWAVRVSDDRGRQSNGVANLGIRPTIGGERHLLEVHLFDFDGELYGRMLDVRFERYIRHEMKFASIEDLRNQIECDAAMAREILSKHPA